VDLVPRVLFVPVSGAKGAGEYFRSLTVAHAIRARWPAAGITFIVSRSAGYADAVPFPSVLIDRSPTYDTAAVNRAIDELRPDVVIFDSAGRVAQLRHARRRGARTVYVSSRPKTRWKGFRLRRMLELDQHWLAWPRALDGGLSRLEKIKLRLMRSVSVVFLDCLFPPPDTNRAAACRRELGLDHDPYVLFCAGGGGYEYQGFSAPEIFGRAAAEVARVNSVRTVWVRGPNYTGTLASRPGLLSLGTLTGAQLIDLLSGARFAVVNGGSLLLQALALKIPCIAAPVAGDQDARIRVCAERRLLIPAELDFTALASAVLMLAGDARRIDEVKARLTKLDLSNGVDTAVQAIADLLSRAGRP
jgi:hypothetical protein